MPLGHLSPKFIDDYWKVVADVLENVFRARKAQDLRELRNEIDALPADEQQYFFHAEPLDVAADLAGAGDKDLSQYVGDYETIATRHHWW